MRRSRIWSVFNGSIRMRYIRALLSALAVVGSTRLAPAADVVIVAPRPGPVRVVSPLPRPVDVVVVRPEHCWIETDYIRVGDRHVVRRVKRCR